MKEAKKGRTHAGYEVVVYVLSSVKEVESIWKKIRDVLVESTGRGDWDFSKSENSFVRFAKVNDELYLFAGTTGKDATAINRKRDNIPDYSSLEAQSQMLVATGDYDTFETPRGMIAVDLTAYLDDEEKLEEIYSKLLNSECDFNMDLGSMVHMSWKPCFLDGKFVVVPLATPSSTTDTWDYKEVEGTIVNLF